MVSVRDARPADAAEVAAVHVRAWQAAYRGLLADDYLDALRPADRAPRYTFAASDADAPRTLLAVEDGAILGFATIGRSRDADAKAAGELYALYVDPLHWRSGVGRVLMAHTYAEFASLGVEEAVLWVLRGNEAAVRFYSADGWHADGSRRREDVWGVAVEVRRYRRELFPGRASEAARRERAS